MSVHVMSCHKLAQTDPVGCIFMWPLLWRHNGVNGISNHQPHNCLLNHSFKRRSKKTSKLRITGLCEGHSLETCECPAQTASNTENVSIWWRHHAVSGHLFNSLVPDAGLLGCTLCWGISPFVMQWPNLCFWFTVHHSFMHHQYHL